MQEQPRTTGFWGSLSDSERTVLSKQGRESVFARGMPLCMEGDASTHVLILLKGWAKVLSTTIEGHEMVLGLRGPGDFVGELAADLGGHRTATVRAVVSVDALSVGIDRFTAFLDTHPNAAHAYRRVMAERQHESTHNLRGRIETSGAQRLARLMLDLAVRCGEVSDHGILLAVPLSQADLATWVGVSRATVTRALHDWRDRGVIRTGHGSTTITDVAALRRIGRQPPGLG
jgi:CRP/FNR family transcriptional regulator, cyclic AMP receptor protein